ncbi:hypothetical protein PRZ48_008612 [Zasmidium cellare]|uniref:Uncharacterized protein n=1 Tax=Zasmidium cellare TaxID=395010 RepID=A0ABR0EH71_ZASCE|nr:hypothetical protein PRZ48_008612 [Zasmidium cellare]
MEEFQPGPLLMVDGRICTKQWRNKVFNKTERKRSRKQQQEDQEKAEWEARQHLFVTVKLPTSAMDDIIKNGPDNASAASLRDIATAIHREEAPVSVPAKLSKIFNIVVIYPGPEQLEKRTFSVSSQDTLHDLAVAIEAALGIPTVNQILNTTCDSGAEVTYHAKEPCTLGTLETMGRLLRGHIVWLSDDRNEKVQVPKSLWEELVLSDWENK